MTFKRYLKRLQKKHYPSVKAFAAALGHHDPSRISRGTPWDVRACLNLAKVTGESPSVVLQMAGKADIAMAIEELYGPPRAQLTPEQQQFLTALAAIPEPTTRTALLEIARAAAAPLPTPHRQPDNGDGPPLPEDPMTDTYHHHHRRAGDAR